MEGGKSSIQMPGFVNLQTGSQGPECFCFWVTYSVEHVAFREDRDGLTAVTDWVRLPVTRYYLS